MLIDRVCKISLRSHEKVIRNSVRRKYDLNARFFEYANAVVVIHKGFDTQTVHRYVGEVISEIPKRVCFHVLSV